jgi:hypothetical protein
MKFLDAWCTRTMRSRIGTTGAPVHQPILLRTPKTAVFARKSWLEKFFGIFLPGPLQFIFGRIIISSVADKSL